jgi:hypothetical protein
MSTTTLTSLVPPKSESKELCIICEAQPYDLICVCGDKFDFNCIHQHVEQIGFEYQDHLEQVTEKLTQLSDLQENSNRNHNYDAARTQIDNWKRKRIQDINDIAEKAANDIQERENIFNDIPLFQETFTQLSNELHHVVHENLNKLINLNQQIHDKIDACQDLPNLTFDDANFDASLLTKLNPSASNAYVSSSSTSNINHEELTTVETEPRVSLPPSPRPEPRIEIDQTQPTVELTNTAKTNEGTKHVTLENTNHVTHENTNHVTHESTNSDEFEAGQTRYIRRTNPILISTNNDKYSATICCHVNQLIYNNYDQTTQEFRLIFLPDINNPTAKQTINWNQPDTSINADDDEWIQDIIYSDKLSSYLLLNRARLRVYNADINELEEFHTFNDRTMKRLSCSEKYIYVTSAHGSTPNTGDEIILMNYAKEEQLRKTFRDIIPTRINRGAGPLVGEISDLAVGANDQVTIAYRLERRQEVGVCVFNVTNNGREWSSVKQLLLNDCWHNNLSYTPRIDWCEKLNVFILIEYITGHLIMVDREGQVKGECLFMHAENRQESPINLTISTNDWLCIRYNSSISIHKLTS